MVIPNAVADRGSAAPDVSANVTRARIASSNLHTTDITDRFRKAASNITPGSLIKDDQFTLFESVGALEIGDPKMDSGCLDGGEDLDHEYDMKRSLEPHEILWLADELMSREVAWYMGYPLSQTLFTSVYIDSLLWPDPTQLSEAAFVRGQAQASAIDPLVHNLFRSYCLGLIKSCDLVLTMVKGQYYYEEEDFATQLFNRELLHRFSAESIIEVMNDAISWLDSTDMESNVKAKLHSRMTFRRNLLKLLSIHSSVLETPQDIRDDTLQTIQASMIDGMAVPDAFSAKIQRRLASSIPPRPMVTIDGEKTIQFWKQALTDMHNSFSILSVSNSNDLLTSYSILNSQKPQPSVYVRALMQSFLSRNGKVCGRIEAADFILDDLRTLTLAGSPILSTMNRKSYLPKEQRRLIEQRRQGFVAKIQGSYLNLFRTLSLNRCRVRRTLCHAAIEWDQIQADAEELDEELQELIGERPLVYPPGASPTFSYSLSSWIYHYKLIQLRSIVQMGFELSIYAPYEMAGMYWYLTHVCGTHLSHLERISYFVSQREATLPPRQHRNPFEQHESQECHDSLQILYRHFSLLKATEALARALHILYTILQRHGQLTQPPTTYASDELRYEIRMKPFSYLSIPEPISFAHFEHLTRMSDESDEDLINRAALVTVTAKKAWEEVLRARWNVQPVIDERGMGSADGSQTKIIEDLWTSDVRGAVKATIATSIAVSNTKNQVLRAVAGKDTTRSLQAQIPTEGERDYWHPWWLVPRISTSQKST